MCEKWKPVKNYETLYEISNTGKLRSLDRTVVRSDGIITRIKGRYITLYKNHDGYLQAKLCKNGSNVTVRIHRLVAQAFIPNPHNLPEVNHKDCNRENNYSNNLEWVTHINNIQYSSSKGHYRHFGKDNGNYQNTTLKKFYAEHPQEALRLLSRPGKQNGRAKPLRAIFPDGSFKDFDYMGDCASYLITNHIVKSNNVNSIRDRISSSIKNNTTYYNIQFEFI